MYIGVIDPLRRLYTYLQAGATVSKKVFLPQLGP